VDKVNLNIIFEETDGIGMPLISFQEIVTVCELVTGLGGEVQGRSQISRQIL